MGVEQATQGTGKGARKALWATVAVIAIAAAGLVGYKVTLEKAIAAQLENRGGKAASVEADFFGRIHLRDVTLPLKDGSDVRIGSVEGRPKFLFLTGMLDASDISTQVANYKISIPHVKIDDADFDIATLRETFGNSDLTLAARVGHFSAKSVAAQEINLVQTIAGKEQKVVYKDVRLDDIRQGHVARYSAAGTDFDFAFELSNEDGKTVAERMTGAIGLAEGKDVDGVFLARLYTEKAGPEDKDARPVYGPFSAKNIVVKTSESNIKYDEIRSGGFSMRMPVESFTEMLEKIETVKNPDDLTPAEQRAFFLRIATLADTIGKGDVEMLGLKIEPNDVAKGKGEVAQVALAFDNGKLDASVKGVSVGEGADYLKMGELSLQGFSWAPTTAGLKKLATLSDEEAENFPYTTLLPEFGTTRVLNIDADLPHEPDAVDEGEDGEAVEEATVPALPERIKFAIKSYEAALTKPKNGIPTDIRVAYEDMTVPVPANSNEEFYTQLRKLGYDSVTFSSRLAANWDEANQNLVVSDISLSGKDMGSIALTGLVGGVTGEFFSGDKVMMQVAALGLKAREVTMKVEEKGLIAKALKLYAEESGMSEEDVRSSVSLIAAASLQDLAADQPKLQEAVSAFTAFLAKPNVFRLTVRSKAEKGIGALEMAVASQNPLLLLDKVDIEAKAE